MGTASERRAWQTTHAFEVGHVEAFHVVAHGAEAAGEGLDHFVRAEARELEVGHVREVRHCGEVGHVGHIGKVR